MGSTFLRRLQCGVSVRSVVSSCISLGHRNSALGKLYPFRGRGAPSFAICPRARSFCYFNYNTNNSTVAFVGQVRGISCVSTLGALYSHYNLRVPRSNCSGDLSGGHHEICRTGETTTGCFGSILGSSRNTMNLRCCGGENLASRAVGGFNLNFTPSG